MSHKLKLMAPTVAAATLLAMACALPTSAQGYHRYETCYDRNAGSTAGGVVAGAIIGGAVGGPPGAVIGGAVGGAAGDDNVRCRYERYEGSYSSYYDNDAAVYGRRDYGEGYGRDEYREGYRDGYNDRLGYDNRLNGRARGYRADAYYTRRSTYRDGFYDRYGVWHPARDSGDRSYRPY